MKLQDYDFRFFNMMMDLENNWMPMRQLFYQSVQQTKAEISWINYCPIIFQPRQLLLQESLWSALASTLDPLNLKENLTSRTKSLLEIRILAKVIWQIFLQIFHCFKNERFQWWESRVDESIWLKKWVIPSFHFKEVKKCVNF